MCWSGGVLLGIALNHMLADSLGQTAEAYQEMHGFPVASFVLGIGFLFMMGVEMYTGTCESTSPVVVEHTNSEVLLPSSASVSGCRRGSQTQLEASYVGTLFGLTLHSVVEGMALGLQADLTSVLVFLLAIALHKGFAAFALATTFCRAGESKRVDLKAWTLFIFVAGTPIGILLGVFINYADIAMIAGFAQAFAAGTTLHIAWFDLISPSCEGAEKQMPLFGLVFGGYMFMSILAFWT